MDRERFKIRANRLRTENFEFLYGEFSLPHLWCFDRSRNKYRGDHVKILTPKDYDMRRKDLKGYHSNENFIKAGQGVFSIITQNLSVKHIGTPMNEIIDEFFKQIN